MGSGEKEESCRFDVVVITKRESTFGMRSPMRDTTSAIDEEGGTCIARVLGSPRPGKDVRRILSVAMFAEHCLFRQLAIL